MKNVFKVIGKIFLGLMVLAFICAAVCFKIWIYKKVGAWIGIRPIVVFLIDCPWIIILPLLWVLFGSFDSDNKEDVKDESEKE